MHKYLSRLGDCVSSVSGFISSVVLFFLSLISGYEGMLFLLLFSIVTDAIWGVIAAIKIGQFARSDLFRRSVVKLAAYFTVFFVLLGIEKICGIETTLPVAVIVSLIALCELWSACGNILIVNPSIPFISLMKHALKGEVARKLQIDEDKVEEYLNCKK